MHFNIAHKPVQSVTHTGALRHELSGKEPVSQVIILKPAVPMSPRQMRKMFESMGFRINVLVGKLHYADMTAVMNIGGYLIPGWEKIAHILTYIFCLKPLTLFTQFAPGKSRLHIRLFQDDETWIIVAHTDWNWMNMANPFKIYNGHFKDGTGDYSTGTKIMGSLLQKYQACSQENKPWTMQMINEAIEAAAPIFNT